MTVLETLRPLTFDSVEGCGAGAAFEAAHPDGERAGTPKTVRHHLLPAARRSGDLARCTARVRIRLAPDTPSTPMSTIAAGQKPSMSTGVVALPSRLGTTNRTTTANTGPIACGSRRRPNRHPGHAVRRVLHRPACRRPKTVRVATTRVASARPISMSVATGTPGSGVFPSVTSMTPEARA